MRGIVEKDRARHGVRAKSKGVDVGVVRFAAAGDQSVQNVYLIYLRVDV